MTNQLSNEQVQAIEEMIARRMTNTGETREVASQHIAEIFEQRINQLSN
jgi:hypothetical protein